VKASINIVRATLADFICNPEFLRALNKPSVIVVFPHPELGADKMIPLGCS